MKRVAVIGGGITGLCVAHRLNREAPEIDVVIFEKRPRTGGKIFTDREAGFIIEHGADSFLTRKPEGVRLCEELEINGLLIGRRPEHEGTFVLHEDTLHRLPEGLTGMIPTNLDAFDDGNLLSEAGRVRLAREVDIPPALDTADESIASFARRRLGREAWERIVEPLMSGIYAGDGEQLSLLATFPRLREIELTHGGLIKGLVASESERSERGHPAFVSFPSGLSELVDGLSGELVNTSLWTDSPVAMIRRPRFGSGYQIVLDNGNRLGVDAVVATTPAFVTARLIEQLDPMLSEAHAAIPYSSCVTVNLAYSLSELAARPEGYGYVVPRIEGREVLACTFVSNKWPGRSPTGQFLVRLYIGRYGRDDILEWDDPALVGTALGELNSTLGIDASPRLCRIHRWRRSMPQYTLGHLDRVAKIEAGLEERPGLFVAGAAYRGVGIPDCIRSAERAADGVISCLARR